MTFAIVPLETPTLGDRSYLVHDGEVAFVVDPQRDIDRVLDLLEEHGVRLAAVFETHVHNDYVTGGLALAGATGAAYHLNGADEVAFERAPLHDGDTVSIGERMRVTALATPGHTFTHLSYALADAATGASVGVFTGGSLLYGATGRPDLFGPEHADTLARRQHASARRLAGLLPDDTAIFPTHGFGSFCAAGQSDETASTIGREKVANPALTRSEEDYVRELLTGLDAWPAYYARMASTNAAGPGAPDLAPPTEVEPGELATRIRAGEWVVDLRHRTVFAAGHVPGTLNFGLDGSFATNLGWLFAAGTPLTLLGDTAEDVAEAQLELVRIGIDRLAGQATGKPEAWTTGPLQSASDRHVRRPGRRPAPPRGGRARRTPPARERRGARRGRDQHPPARAGRPTGRDPGRGGLGALRGRLPRGRRGVPAPGPRPARPAVPGRRRRHLRQRPRDRPPDHERLTASRDSP